MNPKSGRSSRFQLGGGARQSLRATEGDTLEYSQRQEPRIFERGRREPLLRHRAPVS